jgi:hypothetical protein
MTKTSSDPVHCWLVWRKAHEAGCLPSLKRAFSNATRKCGQRSRTICPPFALIVNKEPFGSTDFIGTDSC